MSKEMKYIVTNSYPILFTQCQQHSDFRHFNPSSAGMCRIDHEDGKFVAECYGESISLKLKTNPQDKIFIELMLNHY